ncbi:MAG: copper-binding protein, partial [Blastocatellia bacterium]
MSKSVIRVAFGLGLAGVITAGLVSCRGQSKKERFEIKGRVVGVDKRGSTVTIAHQEIPGFMDAMTMPFTLKDERLLGELAEGDRVQATLVVAGLNSWLEDVVVTRE